MLPFCEKFHERVKSVRGREFVSIWEAINKQKKARFSSFF